MYVLDTDILIDIQRGYTPALDWFMALPTLPSIPGFVVMELLQDAGNTQQLQQALKLTNPLPIIWPTEEDCRAALSNFTTYRLSHGIGLLDSLIAACAVGLSATLCTFNVKHYRVIPDLVTEQPYIR